MTEARPAPLRASHACQCLKSAKNEEGHAGLHGTPRARRCGIYPLEIIANDRCWTADRTEPLPFSPQLTETPWIPAPPAQTAIVRWQRLL